MSLTPSRRLRVPGRWTVTFAVAVAALGALTACTAGGAAPGEEVEQDPNAPIVVWTDATRRPVLEKFQQENPDIKMTIELYEAASLSLKIQLFNRTGKGWPDVVFSPLTNDIAQLAGEQLHFAQALDELVPEDVQAAFGTSNDICKIDGKLYCLRNDLAQTVLWYNQKLMTQFGYDVPKTWDEYRDLGLRVAQEHPGYVIGDAGDAFLYMNYFWSSGCPIQHVTGADTVHISLTDETCTRVAKVLDPLLAAGSMTRFGTFDPGLAALGKQEKILMLPGPSWLGDFLFKPETGFATPAGVLAAAPYPTWSGESTAWSGNGGGGIWLVSEHSRNKANAAKVIEWATTDLDVHRAAPTYPAYGPAAEAWAERLKDDPFYAEDPFPVMQAQAELINPIQSPTRYDAGIAFTNTVVNRVRNGRDIEGGLAGLQNQLVSLAIAAGYDVATDDAA